MSDFKNYESFLSTAWGLSFYGGSEEPLLNKNITELLRYLKSEYGTKFFVNTNASVLTHKVADAMVEYGFDTLLVSYHAGSKEMYKHLMTGNVESVDSNLMYLKQRKEEKGKKKPVVDFNFAMHKLNAPEGKMIIDKAKKMGVEKVFINRYYGGRNKLQNEKVSFEYDIVSGNEALDEIYAYAGKIGVTLMPQRPRYWTDPDKVSWNENNLDRGIWCHMPWTNIHFNPALDESDCHYIGVCNRIELFKIHYRKTDLSSDASFKKIWNHPVLQYLRSTVNNDQAFNPICKFCRNRDREAIRNTNADLYEELRDRAVRDFFLEAEKRGLAEPVNGLEILLENPNADSKCIDQRKSNG